ncbi:hypothetical protein OE749_17340 [Aestuariibacter sp. AA17]|uniref:BAAT/Acyl-CoA thioester hydrolase C-terminal domain-containing protein n=1 Tax=Fluctibacter corallii TaxID=2984329 RepID=A0ABT3ACQ1_9ALTE|nr:acyl-CoA thioester hydrolase/BAAT C-terminal domain-containing protein [Aestuariibacter sp. AA17]MCV2886463.1 hypothetical protein [Aestuariibacter sp. AA17]
MVKVLKYSGLGLLGVLVLLIGFLFGAPMFFDASVLPKNYGQVDTRLYANGSANQPLLVFFGGSEGGNGMTLARRAAERQQYLDAGYAMLAIGYFGLENTPASLDRISLNAIYQEIEKARHAPNINSRCVAVLGGSKGAELALTLASYFPTIKGAVAFAGSHIVYAGTSLYANGEASSFMFNDKQVPFVPLPSKIIPSILMGDFRRAYEITMEDHAAVEQARIKVENIQGPILLVSGEYDHVWPSKEMSDEVMKRLGEHEFSFAHEHIVVPEGNHFQPQKEYHSQAIEFLNTHFLPTCGDHVARN